MPVTGSCRYSFSSILVEEPEYMALERRTQTILGRERRIVLRKYVVAVTVALAALPACSDLGPEEEDLLAEIVEHRRTWESVRPPSYAYTLERQCFCVEEARGPVRVRVTSGSVTERTYVTGGGKVAVDLIGLFPSVEGLFDLLEQAVRQGAREVRITWDHELGVPREAWIDYDVRIADEEQGFRVVELPRPSS